MGGGVASGWLGRGGAGVGRGEELEGECGDEGWAGRGMEVELHKSSCT